MIYIIIQYCYLPTLTHTPSQGQYKRCKKNAKEQHIDSTNYGVKFICYSALLSNDDSGSKWANEVKYNLNIREPT